MKLRWSGLFVVLPTVVAMIVTTVPLDGSRAASETATTITPTADPCEWARNYIDNNMPQGAQERYEELLTVTPTPACAVEGIQTAQAMIACQSGEALLAQGTFVAAADAFATVLADNPGSDCANVGLMAALIAQTPTPTPTATPAPTATPTPDFRVAVALDRRGDSDAAASEVALILENDPLATIPSGLSHLDSNPNNDLGIPLIDTSYDWTALRRRIESILPWAEAWAWILVPTVAAAAFTWLRVKDRGKENVPLRWKTFWSRPVKIDILAFSSGLTGDTVAASSELTTFEKRIETAYRNVEQSSGKTSSKLVLEAQAEFKAPAILDTILNSASILNWIKSAWELVTRWRFKTYSLDGIVFRHAVRGDAIAVELRSGKKVIASAEFRADKYLTPWAVGTLTPGASGQWQELAETIAIWLHSTVAPNNDSPSLAGHTLKWRHWESYAWFRNSRQSFALGDRATQYKLVNQSLTADPGFLPARANRAALRLGNVARLGLDEPSAKQHFKQIADVIKAIETDMEALDPGTSTKPDEWFTARFNRIAALDYAAGWAEIDPLLLDCARRLAEEAIAMKKASNLPASGGPSLKVFEEVLATLETRYAITTTGQSKPAEDANPISPETNANHDDFAVVYTLACHHAASFALCYAKLSQATVDTNRVVLERARERHSWSALSFLAQAMDLAPTPTSREWARFDPSLFPLRQQGDDPVKARVRQEFDKIVPAGN